MTTSRHRTARLELAGTEVVDQARPRCDRSVVGAARTAVAVDDHAAGEDNAAAERPSPQGVEQDRRADVVVGHVVADVGEVDAQADLGGLMADGIDPVDGRPGDRWIPDVAFDELGPLVDRRCAQPVEDSDPHTGVAQGVDHMGTDEASPTGDEDPHASGGAVPDTGRRTVNRQPSPSLRTEMLPWWASTSPRATAKPSPAPPLPGVRAASPR